MIYFVEAIGTGLVKIGKARDIAQRVAGLRSMNAGQLRIAC
jgi:hypothetical protein